MTTENITELMYDHLQEVNNNTPERLKRIDEMLFFLNFHKRLTELSKEERQDFCYCQEGFPWTEEMKKTYENASTEEKKDYYRTMWATSTYMRRCAWDSYLAGYTNKKPTLQKKAELKIAS